MTSDARKELVKFIVTQLIDNNFDHLARKINRYQEKFLRLQETSSDGTGNRRIRKYAIRLQHTLALACSLLQQQQDDLDHCISLLDSDIKKGMFTSDKCKPRMIDHSAKYRGNTGTIFENGSLVSAKIARSHELWILVRVTDYYPVNQVYEVEDVDSIEDDNGRLVIMKTPGSSHVEARRHHFVQKLFVVPLVAERLKKGEWIMYRLYERVMAMYPNTTSFYRATVQVPNPRGSPCVLLKFDDDADEDGTAPDRKVPFRFVTPLPTSNAKPS
uniref:Uncharacterized protein AlNc14C5G716 n=1 Tax=Albugo laibachii Nc14 TaxID=890382 RepID=F0W0T1_9STRA|nr:conserved hypothetical protein [Albugo laibachii Nc14]|eukprot:CCA14655.1 conserved hypothetical protein [Albugo laibachii Nc14]